MRTRTLSILETVVAAVSAARLNRLPLRQRPLPRTAFTLIELLVVITIIIILAGLILATVGYVQKKGATSRAAAEIAAMSAALESYKADNGIYPRDISPAYTDRLDARDNGNPTASPTPNLYQKASQFLYGELSGDRNFNNVIDLTEQTNRSYFTFKPQMLSTTTTVNYIRDPFGNSYGYSTIIAAGGNGGYNPTFDLWSTAGLTSDPPNKGPDTITPQWIKNW